MNVMPSCGSQKRGEGVVISSPVDERGVRTNDGAKEGKEEGQSVRYK